jgi:hypothetical protein
MSFKTKIKKKNNLNTRITLEAKHKEILDKFSEQKIINEESLNDIINYKKQIETGNNTKLTDDEIEHKLYMSDKVTSLENNINMTKNEDIKYLLDNGNLLFDYYKNIDNVADGKTTTKNNIKKIDNTKKTVMEYFNKDIHKNANNGIVDITSKEHICSEYLFNTDSNYVKTMSTPNIDLCHNCHIERTLYLAEGKTICHKCGDENSILIDSDKPSYKDPPREVTYFSYKRINHFNEWLAQFQAKETTDIPQEVYDEILVELKKERITDMSCLSPEKIRLILKKLKKNKYYEHVPHIINKLNGVTPPIMTRQTEEKLRRMFKEIQLPFHKFCPKDRKNFLSYSYVLHKFVELLELDEFIPCFMLLKSREKLHHQDQIWKQICNYLNWQFIPSI